MSISERAARVSSVMLIVAFATTAGGWTAAAGTPAQCRQQTHTCTPTASFTCCCSTAPPSGDTARRPQSAPPHPTPLPASLMVTFASDSYDRAAWTDITSPHWFQPIDLGLLHCTFLI